MRDILMCWVFDEPFGEKYKPNLNILQVNLFKARSMIPAFLMFLWEIKQESWREIS